MAHQLCRDRNEDQREHIALVLEMASMFQASVISLAIASFLTIKLGYPSLPSAKRSAPIPRGQLPPLSEIFTKPATAPHPAPESENEWLDPQLLAESTIQATGKFPGSSSDTSMVPGLKEVDNVGGGSRREDNVDEETGA